jgi:hypothetical protein
MTILTCYFLLVYKGLILTCIEPEKPAPPPGTEPVPQAPHYYNLMPLWEIIIKPVELHEDMQLLEEQQTQMVTFPKMLASDAQHSTHDFYFILKDGSNL